MDIFFRKNIDNEHFISNLIVVELTVSQLISYFPIRKSTRHNEKPVIQTGTCHSDRDIKYNFLK